MVSSLTLLLPPWLSSLLKRADWSPQKSRLVSSNSSLATTARLHTATSRPSRLEQTNRLTTNPPTTQTLRRSDIMTHFLRAIKKCKD